MRQPGEITSAYGLERCSACGGWLVKAQASELLAEERRELSKLGIAIIGARYRQRIICSRERGLTGLCVED